MLNDVIDRLNEDLANEYKHHHFYLQASFNIQGRDRLFLKPWLEGQAVEELGHIKEFASKISAFGAVPNVKINEFATNLTSTEEILEYALEMEQEVILNYHVRHAQVEKLYEETGRYYDLVIFYEDQIEDSQKDVDQIVKMLGTTRT